MNTLTVKYTTLATLNRNYFDDTELVEWMADFGYTVRMNKAQEVYEIVQPVNEEYDTEEIVDWAHPVILTVNGVKTYDIMLAEMETSWVVEGEWFNTIEDDIEVVGYPITVKRLLNRR